jgi:hypothetical protein
MCTYKLFLCSTVEHAEYRVYISYIYPTVYGSRYTLQKRQLYAVHAIETTPGALATEELVVFTKYQP